MSGTTPNRETKEKKGTKSFVLRLDTSMMSAIEAWAADEFRSTNGQYSGYWLRRSRRAGV